MTKGLIRHQLDVYETHLHLATTPRAWAKLRAEIPGLSKHIDKYAGLTTMATWVADVGMDQAHLVFWINVKAHADEPAALVNTCAHEATHGARAIFKDRGERKPSSEAEAYLIGWLTEWLWKGCR